MKLRAKIKELSLTLNISLEEQEASLQCLKDKIAAEVRQRIGFSMAQFSLSLNGRDPLSSSVQASSLPELGVVGGDLVHVLNAQFEPPLTQRVPEVVRPTASLRVEPSFSVAPNGQQPAPADAELAPAESGEPLLLRQSRPGRVPRLLSWLVEQAPPDEPDHLLALALHALMLEAGLQPMGPEPGGGAVHGAFRPSVAATPGPAAGAQPAGQAKPAACRTAGYFPGVPAPRHWRLPDGWNRPGLFQITYGLHFNMALTSVLTIVPLGNVIVVHAVPTGGDVVLTVQLRPRDYVATTESAATADRFQNLRQLSNAFKNSVTVPLLVHLQRLVGLTSPHEWRALPLELQLDILRRLPVRDVLQMRLTCREMRSRADDPLLWKELLFRDFPAEKRRLAALGPDADWKQLYVQLHRQRAATERNEPLLPLPPPSPAQPWRDSPPLPLAPPIAGIIGGEYDRLPSLGFNPPLALPRTRLDSLLPAGRRFGSQPAATSFGGGHFL